MKADRNAKELCKKHRTEIFGLMALIQERLVRAVDNEPCDTWGTTGSLNHVRQSLREILVSLMNADSETDALAMIDEQLDEMRRCMPIDKKY